MANGAVWGIDIGQCALKALQCRAHEDGNKVIAEAFDYIEYPKVLSQPGSDPAELIGDALKQFLSRNSVLGDRVAVSVSGQAGLARFIKLPPVETKKIPDIVRYEARQQIPFDLNDVIWDYQQMGGGSEEGGFALETEVGLFAMKRDAVFRALAPFVKADIEVDIVQLTPLVLYNFLLFDQLGELPPPDEYDSENPPESVVIISLGTDATDIVITNGYRVWQRSIPLGGNHFTKALTKELKLTFAKAEHLKRNATAAADPKAVFQAMRPVFGDLLTELQRSIGYFSNLDRAAKIGRVMALGNAMKLPGLRRYLSQSLGYEIEKLESFRKLVGSQVVSAPSFQENLLSFGVSYGLALQGLAKAGIHTNLLPKEIINDRLIKRKKPWAVAAAAVLLLGCTVSFGFAAYSLSKVNADRWKTAEGDAERIIKDAADFKSEAERAVNEFKTTDQIGQHLVGNVEGRVRWLELLKAVNSCLPTGEDPKPQDEVSVADGIARRRDLHISNLDCQQVEDVSQWYAGVKQWDEAASDAGGRAAGNAAGPAAAGQDTGAAGGRGAAPGPKGPGWIVQISGHHYHNGTRFDQGAQYVRKTLIENLRTGKVKLPAGDPGGEEEATMQELGISCPVLVNPLRVETEELHNPNAEADATGRVGAGGPPGAFAPGMNRPNRLPAAKDGASAPSTIKLQRFDFVVHFCWQPKTPTERREAKKAKEQAVAPATQP
jgi:type IV pilus assembly protein PilM